MEQQTTKPALRLLRLGKMVKNYAMKSLFLGFFKIIRNKQTVSMMNAKQIKLL
jgi:hypothetical protein